MATKPVVVVAMSGGVDSSVAAALLVDQGYTVIGMMLRLWSEAGTEPTNRCCSPDSISMARRVAEILSIPFYVLDARQFFYDHVVKPFLIDYAHNLTPNPCVSCNRSVRWDFLLNHALASGADYLATGHYARRLQLQDGSYQLLRGLDSAKDQSYVLHVLNQVQLNHSMFPLGELTKPAVRQLARKYSLPIADKPDSQDLCFLGTDGDYRSFIFHHEPGAFRPGLIVDLQGHTLGYHQGLPLFTIGQRKGLSIASPTPLYVLEKNFAQNLLIVGTHDELGNTSLVAQDMNWIAGEPPVYTFDATVKIRYKAKDLACKVANLPSGNIYLQFDDRVRDITPGQAAVLYNGEVCLGGGMIIDDLDNQPINQ